MKIGLNLLLSWLLLLCFALPGQAQDETEKVARYRVEVIIFKRGYLEPDADAEHWRKDLTLAYPENVIYLPNTEAPEKSSINEQAASEVFYLPPDARNLQKSAAAIERHPNMEILFHKTWMQNLKDGENAPAIIVADKGNSDSYRALNGWIKLSIARYLHIQTDLWLVDYVQNNGQLPEFWPAIPALPTQNQGTQTLAEKKRQDVATQAQSNEFSEDMSNPFFDVEYNTQPYLIDTIYTLKQKRRMRSGELHYIDHPKLGLLINVESIEEE